MDSTATTPQTPHTPAVPLTVSDQQNSALLDDTLALLGSGLPDKAGKQGMAEIERWEAVLSSSERPGLAKITLALRQLREMLEGSDASTHDIAEVLATLGAETAKIADEVADNYSAPLANLSKLLIKAGSSLSR
ncbi:hypothetical protein GCM10023185_40610 [Hymenobacter saemangeumensis]|uniref:Uncharacterized protein n=1 Tax=Hymenobacter saemangeumensis TaxID=1084522 RepID=A0ABP8IR73_9BACT